MSPWNLSRFGACCLAFALAGTLGCSFSASTSSSQQGRAPESGQSGAQAGPGKGKPVNPGGASDGAGEADPGGAPAGESAGQGGAGSAAVGGLAAKPDGGGQDGGAAGGAGASGEVASGGGASKGNGSPCTASSECQSGVCEGMGCGKDQGTCVEKNRMCTRDLRQYCGCDGQTFQASGSCPGRTYKAKGPCA